MKDALTDMLGHSTPFQDGLAHSGMLTCALKKLEVVKDDIFAALKVCTSGPLGPALSNSAQRHYGYRLVIVGHSLGAGSATLIAVMLKQGTLLGGVVEGELH